MQSPFFGAVIDINKTHSMNKTTDKHVNKGVFVILNFNAFNCDSYNISTIHSTSIFILSLCLSLLTLQRLAHHITVALQFILPSLLHTFTAFHIILHLLSQNRESSMEGIYILIFYLFIYFTLPDEFILHLCVLLCDDDARSVLKFPRGGHSRFIHFTSLCLSSKLWNNRFQRR